MAKLVTSGLEMHVQSLRGDTSTPRRFSASHGSGILRGEFGHFQEAVVETLKQLITVDDFQKLLNHPDFQRQLPERLREMINTMPAAQVADVVYTHMVGKMFESMPEQLEETVDRYFADPMDLYTAFEEYVHMPQPSSDTVERRNLERRKQAAIEEISTYYTRDTREKVSRAIRQHYQPAVERAAAAVTGFNMHFTMPEDEDYLRAPRSCEDLADRTDSFVQPLVRAYVQTLCEKAERTPGAVITKGIPYVLHSAASCLLRA